MGEFNEEINDPKPKRPFCNRCFKAAVLCICNRIQKPVENSTEVTILQHLEEKNHPCGSARVAVLGLKNVRIIPVCDLEPASHYRVRPKVPGSKRSIACRVGKRGRIIKSEQPADSETLDSISNPSSQTLEILEQGCEASLKTLETLDHGSNPSSKTPETPRYVSNPSSKAPEAPGHVSNPISRTPETLDQVLNPTPKVPEKVDRSSYPSSKTSETLDHVSNPSSTSRETVGHASQVVSETLKNLHLVSNLSSEASETVDHDPKSDSEALETLNHVFISNSKTVTPLDRGSFHISETLESLNHIQNPRSKAPETLAHLSNPTSETIKALKRASNAMSKTLGLSNLNSETENHVSNQSWETPKTLNKVSTPNSETLRTLGEVSNSSQDHDLNMAKLISVPPGSALLYPSDKAVDLLPGFAEFEIRHLVVLDGTWRKARRIYYENAWLRDLPHLRLPVKDHSLYSDVRRQPKPGCLSTIESIIYALKILEPETDGLDELLQVFDSMVGDQRRCKEEKFRKLAEAS